MAYQQIISAGNVSLQGVQRPARESMTAALAGCGTCMYMPGSLYCRQQTPFHPANLGQLDSVTAFVQHACRTKHTADNLCRCCLPARSDAIYVDWRLQLEMLKMDPTFLNRNVNQGFSGGEKKRNEILQLAVLEVRQWCSIHLHSSLRQHYLLEAPQR